jgi:hypothetical protein
MARSESARRGVGITGFTRGRRVEPVGDRVNTFSDSSVSLRVVAVTAP